MFLSNSRSQLSHLDELHHYQSATVNLFSIFHVKRGGVARVSGHAQVVEDQAGVFVELAHFLGDAAHALGLDQTDGEAAQAGDISRAKAGADAAASSS